MELRLSYAMPRFPQIRLFACAAVLTAAAVSLLLPAKLPGQEPTVREKRALALTDVRFDNFLGVVATNLEVRPGDEAGLKFRVDGYSRTEGLDDTGRPEYQVHLDYAIDIKDPLGVQVQPLTTGTVQTLLGMQDESWKPSVQWSVRIPESAPPGKYPVQIRVQDKIGGQSVEHLVHLSVRAPALKTSGRFEILQIEFAPSDDGPWRPLWYYERRAPIHVRYKLAGYAVAADRQILVEQDWILLDAEGQEVLRQPVAPREESRGFYPPRFLQSWLSLSLEDPEPGEYKLRIEAHDRIGGQTASAEARFVLRP